MEKFYCLFMLLVLTGCGDKYVEPLVFGAIAWPGYEPAYVARELGYLNADQVHLAEFTNTTEVLRAFRNGQLGVAGLTLDEALGLRNSIPDLRVFMVADFSNGADVLMARRGINSLDQLKGKRIGVEKTALGAYYFSLILRAANLSIKEVKVVSLPLDEHSRAFRAGLVDAVVTFEPVRSELLQQGAEVLFDSTKVPGKIVDVLVLRASEVEAQQTHLQAFVKAWFRALSVIQQDHARAYPVMAQHEQVPVAQLEQELRGLSLADRKQNLKHLSGKSSPLLDTAIYIQRILKENGLVVGSDDLSQFINPRIVAETSLD
jgi:NitT/TauT family transport system substrate-binding protein